MSHMHEWMQARKEVRDFRNILVANRIAGASIFLAVLFMSLYFQILTTIIMVFDIAFITVIWIIDARLSIMMEMAAKSSREIEKIYMKSSSIGHKIKETSSMVFLVRKTSQLFYTLMIAFGFAVTWYNMIFRHSSFINIFYLVLVIYLIFYIYWLVQIEKMEKLE